MIGISYYSYFRFHIRLSGTGSKSADPEQIREWANDPTKRSIPGWADAAAAQAVPVHGDVVRDYLEGGQLADERVVIAHARYNPSGAGSAQHSSGTVFWDDGQGMCRNCGTEEEQRTPPAIVLKHELTHAWMDHYFATDRIMVDAMADQPPLEAGRQGRSRVGRRGRRPEGRSHRDRHGIRPQ